MPEPGDEAVRDARYEEKVWRDVYPDGGEEEAWRHGLREWSLDLAEYTRDVWEYGHQTGVASERAKVEALLDVLTDMANDTMQSRTTENGVVTSWWLPSAYVERLFKAWDAFAVRAGRA